MKKSVVRRDRYSICNSKIFALCTLYCNDPCLCLPPVSLYATISKGERVRLEAEAVLLFLNRFILEIDHWVSSNVLSYEIQQNPNGEHRRRVLSLLRSRHSVVRAEVEEGVRAEELQKLGFKAVDSLHVACAEKASCAV